MFFSRVPWPPDPVFFINHNIKRAPLKNHFVTKGCEIQFFCIKQDIKFGQFAKSDILSSFLIPRFVDKLYALEKN